MKFSMTVGYAIAALVQLASHQSDTPLSVTAMASGTDLPERYLLQIMKAMKDAGLVLAVRGVKGGYKLAKPIARISLHDVCEAVEGSCLPPELPTDGLTAPSRRLIDNTLADIADDERRRLSAVTLDSLKQNG